MTTIVIERGEKSYACWSYLQSNGIKFSSYRLFREEDLQDDGVLAFDIRDPAVAVYCALKFS